MMMTARKKFNKNHRLFRSLAICMVSLLVFSTGTLAAQKMTLKSNHDIVSLKEDPWVQAAYGWLKNNYTLDENPGVGQEGLYYYYHTMAKALTLYGEDDMALENGKKIDWRKEMAVKFVNNQREDGSWINPTARWWENDPVLVSAYTLISLNMITPKL